MTLESITIDKLLEGNSLARFGDGEIKLTYGWNSYTQIYREDVAQELQGILYESAALVGLPHEYGKRPRYWAAFLSLFPPKTSRRQYLSSFISRPDEAEDCPLHLVWQDRDVTLVAGGGSLSPALMPEAKSVNLIECPQRDAYAVIDELEEQIPLNADLVVLCAGATATCLANRLAHKGIQALDAGFVGKFM